MNGAYTSGVAFESTTIAKTKNSNVYLYEGECQISVTPFKYLAKRDVVVTTPKLVNM